MERPISTVTLKAESPSGEEFTFNPAAVTVVVGPNGSGKSLLLRELESQLCGEELGNDSHYMLLRSISDNIPTEADLEEEIASRETEGGAGRRIYGLRPLRNSNASDLMPKFFECVRDLRDGDGKPHDLHIYRSQFVLHLAVRLDGSKRLEFGDPDQAGDLRRAPRNVMTALFQNDQDRTSLRKNVHEAFGRYLVIDPTHPGQLGFRLSDREPVDVEEERGLSDRSIAFHDAATLLKLASDGTKAYVGILAAVIGSRGKVFLIDEPDAFLHPPLARRLGRVLAELGHKAKSQTIAATHSEHFLIGCVESGHDVNVVRLTYDDGVAAARLLPAADLRPMFRDPLMRSSGVLSAVFHAGCMVCEADGDRAFYDEVNRRLVAISDNRAAQDVCFLNSQGKDTVSRIAEPLRRLGLPAAVIVDFDLLKGARFKKLLRTSFVPAEIAQALSRLRKGVEKHFETDDSWRQGLGSLGDEKDTRRVSCRSLIDQLADFGIFVVPSGELESWLRHLGVDASKGRWPAAMFERLGSDEKDPDYVKPDKGDVWDFIGKVATWIRDPNRDGMPRR